MMGGGRGAGAAWMIRGLGSVTSGYLRSDEGLRITAEVGVCGCVTVSVACCLDFQTSSELRLA